MAQESADRFRDLSGGTLHVSITVQGTGGWSNPQNGDHITHTIHRVYEATTRLGAATPAAMDGVTEESALAPTAADAFAPTTSEVARAQVLQSKIEACNGNEACEQAVAMQYAAQLSAQYATPERMAAGTQMMNALTSARFLNLLPDFAQPCQGGRLTVNDTRIGTVTEYGEGGSARIPVHDRRTGTGRVTECADYLSIDTERGTYSVRMTADAEIDVLYEYGADRPATERVRVSAASFPPFTVTGRRLPTTGTALQGEHTMQSTLPTGDDDGTFPVTAVVRWAFTPSQ